MTSDPLLDMLGRLPRVAPDATRNERVRARCHGVLARQQARRRAKEDHGVPVWEPAAVVGLCVLYLAQVVSQVLHLYGLG
jgi:hypothetical protein